MTARYSLNYYYSQSPVNFTDPTQAQSSELPQTQLTKQPLFERVGDRRPLWINAAFLLFPPSVSTFVSLVQMSPKICSFAPEKTSFVQCSNGKITSLQRQCVHNFFWAKSHDNYVQASCLLNYEKLCIFSLYINYTVAVLLLIFLNINGSHKPVERRHYFLFLQLYLSYTWNGDRWVRGRVLISYKDIGW